MATLNREGVYRVQVGFRVWGFLPRVASIPIVSLVDPVFGLTSFAYRIRKANTQK